MFNHQSANYQDGRPFSGQLRRLDLVCQHLILSIKVFEHSGYKLTVRLTELYITKAAFKILFVCFFDR
jgi:hypothetical protein